MLTDLIGLLRWLVHAYIWAIILAALFSMLAAFNVIDTRNQFVWRVGDFLYRVTEPVLAPIRRVLPNFGSVDLSPLVLILILQFLVAPLLLRVQFALQYGDWGHLVL